MQGAKSFSLSGVSSSISDATAQFIRRYYSGGKELPDEIILYSDCEEADLLSDYFKTEYKKSVSILVPKQGVRRQLAEMAFSNAEDYLDKTVSKILHDEDMTVNACQRLKEVLKLSRYPRRMECYDISNVSGVDKVASMVVFIDGEKAAKEYRRFMIKTVEGANDFASLQETLERRLLKLGTAEEEKFPKPDLVVIDGGKGQLSAVKEIFDRLSITDIDLISLAEREEMIFTVHNSDPVLIPKRDYALRLLQRIRDEAHRFAVTYFRSRHLKRNLESLLDSVKGVGKIRKKALLQHFKTLESLRGATVEEIARVDGIGQKYAQIIYDFLRSNANENS